MNDQEFVLAIIAIVMGCSVLIVGIAKIAGLIKAWINRGKSNLDEETFDRLAKAFMQHKKDTERRLKKLESAIDKDTFRKSSSSNTSKKVKEPQKSIEIEDRDEEKTKSGKDEDSNLRNMLRE